MSLRRFVPTNRNAEADQSSLENARTTTFTSNVTTVPTHNLSGRDPVETASSLMDSLGVADPNYVYYRIYAEDGAIPSKTPAAPADPFLGRIKARFVPPPHTAKTVKRSIAKTENIKDRTSTSLFLTPFSQTPMGDADKLAILNRTGPGSTPQEPLALVAKMSDSERSALESGGRDGLDSESSFTDTLGVEDPNYIYYRIYAEDGAIPTKTPAAPSDPFVGRIKARFVPPPHTAKTFKRSISKMENIKNSTSTSLFLTPYSQSPMGDADKVTILNRTGPGSTPQEPLALVAKMSDSERSALESGRRGGLASAAELDTTPPEIRYLYYLLYGDDGGMPSKVVIDPEEPFTGRIRADSVAPPHSPASIKKCISRVERTPALAYADLFADISCDTPLIEGHISILRTDGPGLSPNEPMAIVQKESSWIPDGRYIIKNRVVDFYWSVTSIASVYFWPFNATQWDITHDTNDNLIISMASRHPNEAMWVGADLTGSTIPVPWRLIPADSDFYYLTTDMNHVSQNTLVPAVPGDIINNHAPRLMVNLNEGDKWQMWEFIPSRI